MEHELKTDPEVFTSLERGDKTFELRYNDRGFKVGDTLKLRETVHSAAELKKGAQLLYTGYWLTAEVTHAIYGPAWGALEEGWVIMSIHMLSDGVEFEEY